MALGSFVHFEKVRRCGLRTAFVDNLKNTTVYYAITLLLAL